MAEYLTPKQASEELGISLATISRCKANGAPVHYWGSSGRNYRIILSEFVAWMDRQGDQDAAPAPEVPDNVVPIMPVAERAKRRRELMAALGGTR